MQPGETRCGDESWIYFGTIFSGRRGRLGCSVQQPAVAPAVAEAPAHPLPFKGRLAEGDADALPPAVAMSLSSASAVTFSYREELTHDDYHIPLIVTALGSGYLRRRAARRSWRDRVCVAFDNRRRPGARRLYRQSARLEVIPTLHGTDSQESVELAARAAVREKIDQKLYRDADRLAAAVAVSGQAAAPATSGQPVAPAASEQPALPATSIQPAVPAEK